jgi:hypothetical protein
MSDMVRIALKQGERPDVCDVHLRACVDQVDDVGELADADVLYFARAVDAGDVAGQLAVYPGCAVCAGAASDGTLVLAVRPGARPGRGGEQVEQVEQVELVASIVHALLAAGVAAADVGLDSGVIR